VFASISSSQGNCQENLGEVACSIGDMANGDTVEVAIIVTMPGTHGTLLNVAEVSCSCNDANIGNNTASVGTVVTIGLPRTGQTTCYDQNGTVTDCLQTGQDGDLKAGLGWPDPRFLAGAGQDSDCIADGLTGLMWAKNANLPSGQRNWQGALDYVNTLNSGAGLCGHNDWRVPNINELQSLLNPNPGISLYG
jgi:Protein of unknown function (DUF1566)/Domain of unknown function DUF11